MKDDDISTLPSWVQLFFQVLRLMCHVYVHVYFFFACLFTYAERRFMWQKQQTEWILEVLAPRAG